MARLLRSFPGSPVRRSSGRVVAASASLGVSAGLNSGGREGAAGVADLALVVGASATPQPNFGGVAALPVSAGLSAAASKTANCVCDGTPVNAGYGTGGFSGTGGNTSLISAATPFGDGVVLRMEGNGTYTSCGVSDFLTGVSVGDRYYYEVWFKKDAANSAGVGSIFVGGVVRNSASTPILYPSIASFPFSTLTTTLHTAGAALAAPSSWTKISGIVAVTPADAARINFTVQLNNTVPAGEVYYFTAPVIAKLAPIQATPTSTPSRVAVGGAGLSAVAGPVSTSQELGVATTSLAVSATAAAAGEAGQPIGGGLAVAALATAGVSRVATAAASTAVSVSGGSPSAFVPSKVALFRDYFNAINASNWNYYGSATVSGGKLTGSTVNDYISTKGIYDLTESSVSVRVDTLPATSYLQLAILPVFSPGNQSLLCANCIQTGGVWYWQFYQHDASNTVMGITTTSFAAAGPWVRIGLNAGTVYWDTSVDGLNWVNGKSQAVAGTRYGNVYFRLIARDGAWDDFNIVPNAIDASLNLTATPSTGGSRGQSIGGTLGAVATTSGVDRYDAKAQGALFVSGGLTAGVLKTLYGSGAFGAVAGLSGSGTESGVAGASLGVSAGLSGSAARNAGASADLVITSTTTPVPSRGQSIGAGQTVTASPSVSNTLRVAVGQAMLAAYGFPTATMLRTVYGGGSLAASASGPAGAVEYDIGLVDTLAVTATRSAVASRRQYLSATNIVGVIFSGQAIQRRNISASLAANQCTGWATIEEPMASVSVKFDQRTAQVAATERRAEVAGSSRLAAVPTSATAKATV